MTNTEVKKKYKALQKHYGDALVNFEHHPRQFMHQVKLFNYLKSIEKSEKFKKNSEITVVDYT